MKNFKTFNEFINEGYVGPFMFSDNTSDEELKLMHDAAVSGFANWQKGFEYPKADYKKAYTEIEAILKKRGVKESVNEAVSADELIKYVKDASNKTFKGGGNGQNLLDSAMELASHIDSNRLGRDTRGYEEDGFYGPTTVTLFKRLVDQMSKDDTTNNRED